jgi:hypothetical protein
MIGCDAKFRGGVAWARKHSALVVLLCSLPVVSVSNGAAQTTTGNVVSATVKSLSAPLTGRERWKFYVDEAFATPLPYVAALGAGLVYQASGTPHEWGGGFKGYGRRAASEFGLLTTQSTIHDAGEAVFGYEPRYFPCQCTGAWKRTGHALEMSFLTYDGHGHKRLDLPQLMGAYGGGMISALWYPQRYSPLVQGVQTGHLQVGFVVGFHLYQEFSPEIQRKLHLGKILDRGFAKPQ